MPAPRGNKKGTREQLQRAAPLCWVQASHLARASSCTAHGWPETAASDTTGVGYQQQQQQLALNE